MGVRREELQSQKGGATKSEGRSYRVEATYVCVCMCVYMFICVCVSVRACVRACVRVCVDPFQRDSQYHELGLVAHHGVLLLHQLEPLLHQHRAVHAPHAFKIKVLRTHCKASRFPMPFKIKVLCFFEVILNGNGIGFCSLWEPVNVSHPKG